MVNALSMMIAGKLFGAGDCGSVVLPNLVIKLKYKKNPQHIWWPSSEILEDNLD